MKKTLLTTSFLLLVLLVVPIISGAHTGDPKDSDTGFGMMRMMEDQALGDELHEEMENLMGKMMSGTLSEKEVPRLLEFMDEYPGVQSMMMSRMMGMGALGSKFNSLNKNSMIGLSGMGGFWGGFSMILFWVLVIIGIVALIKYTAGNKKSGTPKSALGILEERYAKGEIDKNEFEAKKKDLQN